MSAAQEEASSEVPVHTDEIKSTFELRVGKYATLHGSARITPVGVISVGIAAAAITLAVGYLISSTRRRR